MKKLILSIVLPISLMVLRGIFILCLCTGVIFANDSTAQNKSINEVFISLQLDQSTIKKALESIERKTDFKFGYSDDEILTVRNKKLTLDVENESVATILKMIANQTDLSFKQVNQMILVRLQPPPEKKSKTKIPLPDKTITGKVVDDTGQPLPGANVLVKGTTRGVITDAEGNYKLNAPDEATTLVFSFIGFLQQEVAINGRSVIDVTLYPDAQQLKEVIVVGYGEQSKAKVTGSISKVTAKDIENLPVTSVDQALQGQAPGVLVTSASGTPGGGVLIRIRGQTSINAGNDPLYVIDGIPIVSGSLTSSLTEGPGGQLNALSGINPGDIASIEVLKDAAATAIYGSRAANGVVLITTKQGKKGATSITLDVMAGVGEETNRLDLLNSEEYLMIKREAYENDGLPIPDDLANADASINTDWQDEVYRKASVSQYQLSIDGGTEKTQFYLSGSYRNEEAILKNAGLKRGTFRLNIDHQANDKLMVGTRIALSRESNNLFTRNGNLGSPLNLAAEARPDFQVRDASGEFTNSVLAFGVFGINPVEELLEPKLENTSSKVLGSAYINYSIIPGLDFRTDAFVEYNILEQNFFFPSSTINGVFTQGQGYLGLSQTNTYNIEPTIRFEKTLGNTHNINAVVGSTLMERDTKLSNIRGGNFINDDLGFLVSAGSILPPPNTFATRTDYSFSSVFARVNYDYDNKYLIGATLRRDGSSRFGSDNKFGTFWAISAGWLFTNEPYLENSGILSYGKLRASYGVTGNDQIGDFDNLEKWAVVQGYGGISGIAPTQAGNPELGWEQTSKLDFGLELSFWKDRIGIEVDYFLNRTTDLLFARPLPGTASFSTVASNIGETENKGFEVGLNTVNIRSNTFSWSSRLNITSVKNKIVSLVDDEPILFGSTGLIVGQPINILRGLNFLGVDPETGDALYEDVSGDGTINAVDDNVIIGNALPDFYGGFINTFSWKNLTLDVFLQFVNNVHLFDISRDNNFNGGVDRANQITDILKRWQTPGDVTDVPRVTTNAGVGLNNQLSSRFVFDASYLRVKNITLSYNLPWTVNDKLGISNARLFLTGTNLFTITDFPGLDPEASSPTGGADGITFGNLTQVKMFLAGISLKF